MHSAGLRHSTADLITSVGDRLTPTDRRIAEAVLADPSLLAFGTVTDLASHVGTSRPSVVRFANKLGFDGYTQLQESVQRDLSQRLFRPSDRIRQGGDPTAESARTQLADTISEIFDALDAGTLGPLGDAIADADTVWVVSGETSLAGANTLVSGLSIVRPDVHLVDGHSVGTDLAGADDSDVAVVFDFYRYRRHAIDTAQILSNLGVRIVAITDGPLSPLAALTDMRLDCNVPAIGPFDSSVPSVVAAELLVARVAQRLHTEATERIDRTEAMWDATGTFVKDSD